MDIFLAHTTGRFGFEGDLATGGFVAIHDQGQAVETGGSACALLIGRIDVECKFLDNS